jgi:valyl-tRNA synthetase
VEYTEINEITKFKVPNHAGYYEFGAIHSFAYQVKGSEEKIVVATTRLETMLGDVAVAVHPEDPRYKHLIGKELLHPFIPDRVLTVIADPVLVDMTFGTGAVKVTPAHDYNDFKCGERNNLEKINIFTEDGKINENGGKFEGLMRFDCRVAIEKELTSLGLYLGKEKNPMSLGFCSRSQDVIEPYLKPQWWVECSHLAQRACTAVRDGSLKIVPEVFEDNWFQWLENIQDWCVSRQLWWGHRIPAYRVFFISPSGEKSSEEKWVVGRTREEALSRATALRPDDSHQVEVEQDEDVLDTWFSSGLFPFSTLGWPDEESADFQGFFPGTLLETGHDILFFWVARMVMMSLCLTDQLPFRTVYLHALIRDSDGVKMSKSQGNVIDPLEVINGCSLEVLIQKLKDSNLTEKAIASGIKSKQKEFPEGIPPCGADAMRIGLLSYTLQGRNINLDIKRVVGYRLFMNKLWNIFKFALSSFPEGFRPDGRFLSVKPSEFINRWMVSRLNKTIESVNNRMKKYEFGNLVQDVHGLWIHEIADVYLEAIKPITRSADEVAKLSTVNTLFHVLEKALLLLHPMTPFITEELYHRLPESDWKAPSISIASYPQFDNSLNDDQSEEIMEHLEKTAHIIRSMQASLNLFGKKPSISVRTTENIRNLLEDKTDILSVLGKSGDVKFVNEPPQGCLMNVDGNIEVFLVIAGMVNVQAEITKLEKKLQVLAKSVEGVQKKMQAPNYEEKTPDNVKESFQSKMKEGLEEMDKIRVEIEKLKFALTS